MKKKTIIMSCLAVVLLLFIAGITYAAFAFTNTGSANTITSGKINFSYTEPSNSYTIENAVPVYDTDGKASTDYFEFVVSSNATTNSDDDTGVSLPFEISIESVSVDTGKTALDNDEIKVYLTSVASGTETEELAPTLISGLADSSYSGKLVLSGTHTYKNNSSAISTTYRLRAWIDSDVDVSSWSTESSYQYKFKVNVNANASSKQPPKPETSIVSGNINTVGSEVTIGEEHFYVIGDDSTNTGNVKLLAKWNLKVGDIYNNAYSIEDSYEKTDEGYNYQSEEAKGTVAGQNLKNGIITFASTNYWSATTSSYPAYVYNSNSNAYPYVEAYKKILEDEYNVEVTEARLMNYDEATSLGCEYDDWNYIFECSPSTSNSWLLNTSFWLGSAAGSNYVYSIFVRGDFRKDNYVNAGTLGVRPLISVPKTDFN